MAECPCGAGKEYRDCCEPYHRGELSAPTAEALLRARYSAYVHKRLEFIRDTLDPKTRSRHDPERARKWAQDSEWLGLEILKTEGGGAGEQTGAVEFIARYKSDGEKVEHHELASFRWIDGKWHFTDGRLIGPEPIRREAPKVGRNDPCPCGSGRKYKKCCGVEA